MARLIIFCFISMLTSVFVFADSPVKKETDSIKVEQPEMLIIEAELAEPVLFEVDYIKYFRHEPDSRPRSWIIKKPANRLFGNSSAQPVNLVTGVWCRGSPIVKN